MRELGYTIIGAKETADGRRLYLGKAEDGSQTLLEALNLTVSGREVSLLRDLRNAIQALPAPGEVPGPAGEVVMYQELLRIEGELYLQLPYDERIWDNWENNGVVGLSPQQVVTAAEAMLTVLDRLKNQEELDFTGFTPQDLVLLGPEEWAVFDPRVRTLLVPYRAEDRQRRYFFPPEIIKGERWTEDSHIYTIGLTLYLLGTGVFPYPLDGEEKTVTAIMREKPLDPRYHRPEISESLARFILTVLHKEAKERLGLASAIEFIRKIKETGDRATPEEEARLREEAGVKLRQAERRRRAYWWWQRTKIPALVGAFVLVFLFAVTRGGYQEIITPQTKPEEVVGYFYEAISELDDLKLQETLDKAAKRAGGKEFDNMVVNLKVIHKMRLAYEGDRTPALIVDNLKLTRETAGTVENPVFEGEYTLKILEGDRYLVQERRDRIILGRVKDEWRIIALDSQVVAERIEAVPLKP
ncbi:MAG TPA: hypothetical protein GXZ36_04885 [Firmicutes bacterium]|nr:hypothetical protein [Bacillota bacterium]